MATKSTIHISAQVSPELGELLTRISKKEERSKSYYVKKSLEEYLKRREEDIVDYEIAEKAHEEWVQDGMKTHSMEEVFAHLD